MEPYILGGGIIAILATGGWGLVERNRALAFKADLVAERHEVDRLTGLLVTCNARIDNIKEAEERESLIPDDLRGLPVPDGRLLPETYADPAGPD